MSKLHEVIIIGAGQAGLATAYYLTQLGIKPLLLEAHDRVGDNWRKRWDSLQLFSPVRYSSLPGWGFALPAMALPTKDEVGDYMEAYAQRFGLQVRTGVRVQALTYEMGTYKVLLGEERLQARQVVVTTGAFGTPYVPVFAGDADAGLFQMHVSQYKNPGQLPAGPVLVVGTGASGSQIAAELAREAQAPAPSGAATAGRRKVYLSGPETGHLPRRFLGKDIYWWLYATGAMAIKRHSWLGRRMARDTGGDFLIGKRLRDIVKEAGLLRRGLLSGFEAGKPVFADGQAADDIGSILWATGYRNDYSWIKLPILDAAGQPRQLRGVVEGAAGLYFVGLRFMHRIDSSNMGGMGRDAEYVAQQIAKRN
jgi:putative flavoprotein involved in K+ transport